MKWIFCGAGVVLLAALILAGCSRLRGNANHEDVDGGVVTHRDGTDAPKVIESTEISKFRCTISLLSKQSPGKFGHRVYKLEAFRKDGEVHCTYDWYGRGESEKTVFETDTSFLDTIEKLVFEYGLAKHNGFYHSVSGLPDMYGDVLDITYASGEEIYASDNQSSFLTAPVRYTLITLFGEASGKIPGLLPVTVSEEAVSREENGRPIRIFHPVFTLSDRDREKYPLLNDALFAYNEKLREEYRTKLLRLRQAAQTSDGDSSGLYAENEVFVTRSDSQIFSFYEKREETDGVSENVRCRAAYTFDTKTGRELRFEDVFEITDELYEMLFIELQDACPELTLEDSTKEIIAQAIRENDTAAVSFALSPGCAHVFFIGSYFPSQHIILSAEDYPHFFKPEWNTVPLRQMIPLDRNINYPLGDGRTLRMEFLADETGTEGEWVCSVKDFYGKKQEYRENFRNTPFDVYYIGKNLRQFLYLNVPADGAGAKTNVYEITGEGISFIGQTDAVMYETVHLDPDRILMMRLDESGGAPVQIYGICRVGDDGMPVWIETAEK
ncbi:MAG: hypothetical protein IJC71_03630 [Clostridia bacterium]|nr:hypothetical protein [Clostridia bacterium]